MNIKPILLVAGEPFSIFSEILFKTLKKNKFKKPIYDYKIERKKIKFLTCNSRLSQINGLREHSKDLVKEDFYIKAIDSINPRSNLLHILDY